MLRDQNARQNHNIKVANISFENTTKFKNDSNKLDLHAKVKSRLNMRSTCRLLSKNLNMQSYTFTCTFI
jgi:hypothetical protein